jgi:hypothetical protein
VICVLPIAQQLWRKDLTHWTVLRNGFERMLADLNREIPSSYS